MNVSEYFQILSLAYRTLISNRFLYLHLRSKETASIVVWSDIMCVCVRTRVCQVKGVGISAEKITVAQLPSFLI